MIEITPQIPATDTSPLTHLAALAAIGCLHLLNELGSVTVVDMVRHEATDDRNEPFARAILILAEKRGLVEPEENLWKQLIDAVPTASPENRMQAIRRRGPVS